MINYLRGLSPMNVDTGHYQDEFLVQNNALGHFVKYSFDSSTMRNDGDGLCYL
jgi:hypothetical protein